MTRDEHPGRKHRNGAAPRRAGASQRGARQAATPDAAEPSAEGKTDRQRIAKRMARVGLCSRRDAESWIVEGRVSVNGAVLTSPAVDVGANDQILVDGAPLPAAEKTRLFLFHKPAGLITSDHDPEGRATVADYLREHWADGPRVVTVGRLDFNTEGLLLLTNDGGLARVLELPRTGWVRRYRVRAKGQTDQAVLDRLFHGVTIEGIDYAGIEAKLDRIQGANCWLTMGLREGKNREVKRILEHIGLDVNRLIRLSFGPFQLLDLPEGQVEEVKTRVLRDQLGPSLAALAGVDYNEPEPAAVVVPPPKALGHRTERGAHRRDEREPSTARPAGRSRTAYPSGREVRPRDRDETPRTPEKRERPAAGPRRHVSTLRAATTAATQAGPRKRRERTDTTDRKNRPVAVERLVSQAAEGRRERRDRSPAAAVPTFAKDGRGSQSAQGKRERIARSGGSRDPSAPRSERGVHDGRFAAPLGSRGEPRRSSRPAAGPHSGKTPRTRPSAKPAVGAAVRHATDKPRRSRSTSKQPVEARTKGGPAGKVAGGRPPRGYEDRCRGGDAKGKPRPSKKPPRGRPGGSRPPRTRG